MAGKNKSFINRYEIKLTKEELLILIKATNWSTIEYYQKNCPEDAIKVSELNSKLNEAYNGKI